MPQEYKRKTNRGSNPDFLQRAAADVQGGSSIRSAAKDHGVDCSTLKRYMGKAER